MAKNKKANKKKEKKENLEQESVKETKENTEITKNENKSKKKNKKGKKQKKDKSKDNVEKADNPKKETEINKEVMAEIIDDIEKNKKINDANNRIVFSINKTNFIKCSLSIILTFIASLVYKNLNYFVYGTIEILLIFTITQIIYKKFRRLSIALNNILCLLYNLEVALLLFSGTFLKRIMLSNLESIEDLSGKSIIYIGIAILVFIISFLKVKENKNEIKNSLLIITVLILSQISLILLVGKSYSPLYGYVLLVNEEIEYQRETKEIENNDADIADFYKKEIKDYVKAPSSLGHNPNVILILTEGLSQNIIDDKRIIMPNVKEYQNKSIKFTEYYNHAFATYKGIIGQLYSGYQRENLANNRLISIQSILKDKGYNTCFINTEPKNIEFTRYLKNFGFNDVISDKKRSGYANTLSDKEAYELILNHSKELNNKDGKPFFICIYTFGTHVSLDSIDEKYENGLNPMLNKFYDLDYQFGNFMKEFENSSLYDNTIIVFTTDHCSYKDFDYETVFGSVHNRVYPSIDEVPLFIYHKGVSSKNIAVGGRNSLCLAPTILDYLDISAENYFLGSSLFAGREYESTLEYAYNSDASYCTTKNGMIVTNNDVFDSDMREKIKDYFTISRRKNK